MGSVEEKIRTGGLVNGAQTNLLEEMKLLKEFQDQSGLRKAINSELWYACAGPLVSLPQVGSLVYYFPQGHSEQVAVSTRRSATSQIPNYPNLPSQLLCQVHNVTLHADKDTDEIYAQMSLQPVNTEKDVFPIPDFGLRPSKHPSEFFCKTLTASDTSTHGGFSVPRRAAEKLFPPLDYTMQPPTQELVVRDLHDNTWTFRHIYRGQPKRHLLTTGWSLFVGSKRLKAGDSVLFIRDEKSQLMVGVRRANRQQTTLPSSVLSADSMHIGVLAAAAHATANRSPFTIFYNPRACPSDFVIPLIKFRKAVFGTQVSVGMRFGMMFETEESGKRRYMGTIVGISDLDPLRWPGSKWRNLQVEWDEPGCSDKQNRVSSWEIETPESLFIFPSLTSGLKRPLQSGFLGDSEWGSLVKKPLSWLPGSGNANLPYASMSNISSEQLINMLMKPHPINYPGICGAALPEVSAAKVASLDVKNMQATINQMPQLNQSGVTSVENQNYSQICLDQSDAIISSSSKINVAGKSFSSSEVENQASVGVGERKLKAETEHLPDQLSQLTSTGECIVQKPSSCPMTQQNATNHLAFQNQSQGHSQLQTSIWPAQAFPESSLLNSQQIHSPLADATAPNCSLPFLDADEWISHPMSLAGMYRSGPLSMFGSQDTSVVFPEAINPSLPFMNQDVWDHQMSNSRFLSQANQLVSLTQQEPCSLNSGAVKDLSDESNDQSGIYGSLNFDASNGGGSVVDPSVSSAILDEFCTLKDADLQNASDCLVGNLSSSQDVQSQITSASLADSQAFSRQDFPDNSGGTSSSNVDFDNSNMLQLVPSCFSAGIGKMGWSKLEEITSRLQEIVAEKDLLDLSEWSLSRFNERLPTTSLMEEKPRVYGRGKDKEVLVELLMRGGEAANGSPFSVISIIGFGGVGKTTLVQLVYNDKSVEFDYKAWVCVSDDFDVLRITKTILSFDSSAAGCDLNLLQVQLKEKLSGKKFLIVLDDVWSENYEEWTALCSPFASGARGSKVIITTRNEGVSLMTGSIYAYALKELSDDDCLLLFAKHALDASNFDDYPDLKEIGEEIVKRCRGLPLAAKTLGGLLRGKRDSKEWKVVLNSKMWDLPEENSEILPALRLSYHHLPSHLKQCFAYCAIFPKDYEFDKNELVSLWMAEGFLQQPKEKKQMKDIGKEYFHDLLSRSFFQQSSANNVRYVMHDLISELAQFVSGEVCFHLGDKLEDSPSHAKVRHSSFTRHRYDISQRFEVFYEMKSLRTFLPLPIFSPSYNHLTSKVLHDLVPHLKRLAVLSLAGYCLVELPSSICALKHLRYLNLSYTEIEVLPESLCEVFRLQTLGLRGCKKLIKLPIGIDNLIDLQYLDISGTDSLQEMPPQIGNLTNLHTLPKFIMGKGLGIRELMKLSHLQGQLNITGLHNVVDVQDTELAILKEKRGLSELSLEWIHNVNGFQSEARELQLLNLLEPHQTLQKLSIMSYGGTTFPSWLGDHSFTNMVCLQLRGCHKITSLPSLGQLPLLRDLSIRGMDKVTTVGAEFLGVGSSVKAFPSLEGLIIEDMLNWKQWSWSNGLNQEEVGEFPNLRDLTIINCPMLAGKLPSHLPSVKKLSICYCPELVALPEILPCLCELIVEGCNEAILNHMSSMPSLTTLKVGSINGLVCLSSDFLQALVALQDLEIANCNDLMYLWQDGTDLHELASMKHLEIKKFEQLVSLVELEKFGDLEQLPSGLQFLGSLRNLKVDYCPKLVSFPGGLPYTLQRLEISRCDSLKSLPDGMVMTMNGCKSSQCLLEELLISWCPSLKSIPRGMLPITLKSLAISWCKILENLHGGIVYDGGDRKELSRLEHLTIEGLPLLPFPAFEFPGSLKTLEIGYCTMQSLESLCDLSLLTELEISGCSMLESFPEMGLITPNLISLSIWKCENLRSLPDHMDCLVSLQEFSVYHCHSLVSFSKGGLPPNLIEFEIHYCENVTESMLDWGLHTLIFLKRLVIECTSPCTNMVSFPDDEGQLLPTSLTSLYILSFKGLKSISKGLNRLMSLEILMISDCPKLCFLPTEGFPATLGSLHIEFCPLLKKKCSRKNGRYWSMIAFIPCVIIQDVRFLQMKSG